MRFGALSPLGVTAGCIQPRDWRAAGAPISGKPLSRLVLHSHAIAPPQFVGPGNAAHFLIGRKKTSYTAGTLCAIFSEICLKNS
jgi:hypothetical protein